MSKKADNKFSTTISSLAIMLLVVLVIGFLFFRTDNFTTGLKTFYVKNGGNTFIGDYANFSIVKGKEYKFEIVSNLDDITNSEKEYTVSIVPNTNVSDFKFLVDDSEHSFHEITSLTKSFQITAYSDYFILIANKDMQDILQEFYYNQTISNCPTAIDTNIPYFRLVVTSTSDEVVEININFNIKSV